MKYRALVGFAGSVLSMFAGEEKEVEDDVAEEFVKVGYIVALDNSESEEENQVSDNNEEEKEVEETKKSKKKVK